MGEGVKKTKKRQILNKLFKFLNQYSQVLVIQLENVGSNQIQDARFKLRKEGLGEMLVTKNVNPSLPHLLNLHPFRLSSRKDSP